MAYILGQATEGGERDDAVCGGLLE